MPSGKTHDGVTFFLAVPVWILIWRLSGSVALAAVAGAAFLFGGLMFGPDLDTKSVQYGRWGVFKVIWFPYKFFFKHRSVWTHGLLFGTLLRIIYFLGFLTIVLLGIAFIAGYLTGNGFLQQDISFVAVWREFGSYFRGVFGKYVFYIVFAGLWLGAASHSLADWSLSYIKTGKPG
jgi:uncharacterized metal-binding protein